MGTVERTGAAVELELELSTGTVIIDGERIELPPKEFALLAHLAARPGQAVSRADLIEAVWPETPLMTDQDLYWYVNRLRETIGDKKRASKVVANRRGFGYLLDLPSDSVKVFTASGGRDPEPEPQLAPSLPTGLDEERPVPLTTSEMVLEETTAAPMRPWVHLAAGRNLVVVASAVLLVALLGIVWTANRTDVSPTTAPPPNVANDPAPESDTDGSDRPAQRENREPRRRNSGDVSAGTQSSGGDRLAAAPSSGGVAASDTTDPAPTNKQTADRSSTEQQLPPPPTRFLYHLVHPDTGEHFVTTDPAASTEREAAGYVGGAIARVYTTRQPGTKAISTNLGVAYIFVGSSPKTSPPSKTVPLWFANDGKGDFFYATNRAEIPEDWSSSIIGYVVAP